LVGALYSKFESMVGTLRKDLAMKNGTGEKCGKKEGSNEAAQECV